VRSGAAAPPRPRPGLRILEPVLLHELQGVQELTNFFERRSSAYQVAVEGSVSFDDDF
jgi:hypothetical protein